MHADYLITGSLYRFQTHLIYVYLLVPGILLSYFYVSTATRCLINHVVVTIIMLSSSPKDLCGCVANTTLQERERLRREYDDWRDVQLNKSMDHTECVLRSHRLQLVAISVLEYRNASYVARHLTHTLRFIETHSLIVVHLNRLSDYRDSSKAWHPELHSLMTEHPRVLLNPKRIAVQRGTGSILAAHLLNIKHLLKLKVTTDGTIASPDFVMLMASNMWLMRPGVEAFVGCHVSSVRFGLATRACVPDVVCPASAGTTSAQDEASRWRASPRWHTSTLCRHTVLRQSEAFAVVADGWLQKCAPEGQFHPIRIFETLIERVEGVLGNVSRLSALPFLAEESIIASTAASALPHLLAETPSRLASLCFSLAQTSRCGPRGVTGYAFRSRRELTAWLTAPEAPMLDVLVSAGLNTHEVGGLRNHYSVKVSYWGGSTNVAQQEADWAAIADKVMSRAAVLPMRRPISIPYRQELQIRIASRA